MQPRTGDMDEEEDPFGAMDHDLGDELPKNSSIEPAERSMRNPVESQRQRKENGSKHVKPQDGRFDIPEPKPIYYEEKGLRKVVPYDYAFHSHAKERWQGRTLIDVYGEFRDRSKEYYNWAITTGTIMVNGAKSSPGYVLKNGDLISNVIHRHEPPVVSGPVRIIYDGRLPGNDGETFVVEKPGSMPIHSTGRYHFNTLLSILKYDYDLPLVHTSNRLDRLTSGVMVCSLTVEASKKVGAWFGGRRGSSVEKEYVARCLGKFPDGEVVCEQPLLTIDRQIGVNVVHPEGRHARTIFQRLSYHTDSNTSVLLCRPITGRSHQIRVHLQYMGYPIANDPVYQNSAAWGKDGGKGGVFGKDRGGNLETREQRREMGEKLMMNYQEKEKELSIAPENHHLAQAVDGIDPSQRVHSTEDSGTRSALTASLETSRTGIKSPKYSKRGTLKFPPSPVAKWLDKQPITDEEGTDLNRGPHDAELSAGAKAALGELRKMKDAADGGARRRDTICVETARRTNQKPPMVDSIGLISDHGSQTEAQGTAPIGKHEAVEGGEEKHGDDGEGDYCKVCFTPSIPDPKPEQLFIWLHAMRYKTAEWDWSSPMPYWALDTWEPSEMGNAMPSL